MTGGMLHRITRAIRGRFHPLHALRHSKLFSSCVMPLFDVPVSCNLHRVGWKVRLRAMRHMSWMLNSRILEPGVVTCLVAVARVTKPRKFWDVGAHIGYHSWVLMTENPELEAVLFEPDPVNAKLLEETIALSGLRNAKALRVAASDVSGEAEFALDSMSGATGSLVTSGTFNERWYGLAPQKVTVKTVRLDDLTGELGNPDLIKIDVESAEHQVFAGAAKILSACRPVLLFESFPANRGGLIQKLESQGYWLSGADEPGRPVSESINLLALPPQWKDAYGSILSEWTHERSTWEDSSASG